MTQKLHQAPDLFTVFQNYQNVSLEFSRFGIAVLDIKKHFQSYFKFQNSKPERIIDPMASKTEVVVKL